MGDELNLVGDGLIEAGNADGLAVTGARSEPPVAEGTENFLVLRMDELLPDAGGEVVLLDDAGEGFAIVTHNQISGQGVAEPHVTASGLDVNGFSFTAFDSGITVFYPSESKLLVLPETA